MKHSTYFIFLCFLVSCQTKTESNTKTKIDLELVKAKEIIFLKFTAFLT